MADKQLDAPVESLAQMLESNKYIRRRLRDNGGSLVKWPSPELTGRPTMQGIALNVHALQIVAAFWCPPQRKAKSPDVQMLKREARV